MSDVPLPERERISMWIDTEIAEEIERLAANETEGNRSLMTRKLLREALTSRNAKEQAR